jgi:hypothetical protein
MYSNMSGHYFNYSESLADPGLFYLLPVRRLENQEIVPTSGTYVYENWNFSVEATSGDYANMTIKLFLKPPGGSFSECTTCVNQTAVTCTKCDSQYYEWHRNFSSGDVGTWFYQIQMVNNDTAEIETLTSGTDNFEVQDMAVSTFYINYSRRSLSPTSAGWGFNFTFNISAQSDSTTNVSALLWRSSDGSTFSLMKNYTQNFTDETNLSYQFDPTSDDTDSPLMILIPLLE